MQSRLKPFGLKSKRSLVEVNILTMGLGFKTLYSFDYNTGLKCLKAKVE